MLACSAKAQGTVDAIQLVVTNTSSTVPVRLSSNHMVFTYMTVIGNKSERVANTGTVFIGPTSTNDTQALAITTGQMIAVAVPPTERQDLYNWWLDPTTANDGVIIILTKKP